MELDSPILVGPLAGETVLEEWIGTFNNVTYTGLVGEVRQLVRGQLHFSVLFDTPIPAEDFDAASDAAAAKGIDFRGNNFNNAFVGYIGNDLLLGGGGNDFLEGYEGDDKLDGQSGKDWMEGGSGSDVYYVDNQDDRVVEYSGEGTDLVYSSITFALTNYVENLALTGHRRDRRDRQRA